MKSKTQQRVENISKTQRSAVPVNAWLSAPVTQVRDGWAKFKRQVIDPIWPLRK